MKTARKSIGQVIYFLQFSVLPAFCFLQNDSTWVSSDSSRQALKRLDYLEQRIERYDQGRTDILLREAQNNIEIASKIIDWTATILTLLAIGIAFMGFLGWQSIRDVRRQREDMRQELQEMTKLREESRKQITDLQARMEKESKSLMDFLYYSNVGDIHFQRLEIDLAIENYNQALLRKTDNAEIHLKLGRAYFREAKYDEAIKEFMKSIEFAPDGAKSEHFVRLGRAYRRKGDIENAKAYYQKALDLSATSPWAMDGLALISLQSGDHNKAIELFRKIYILRKHPSMILNLGIAYALANMRPEAENAFREVLEIAQRTLKVDAMNKDALYLKVMAFAGLNDESNATAAIENAIQIDRTKGTIDSMRNRLELMTKQPDPPALIGKLLRMLESE